MNLTQILGNNNNGLYDFEEIYRKRYDVISLSLSTINMKSRKG